MPFIEEVHQLVASTRDDLVQEIALRRSRQTKGRRFKRGVVSNTGQDRQGIRRALVTCWLRNSGRGKFLGEAADTGSVEK